MCFQLRRHKQKLCLKRVEILCHAEILEFDPSCVFFVSVAVRCTQRLVHLFHRREFVDDIVF